MRIEIKLTKDEHREFRRLKPVPNVAFAFWERIARSRNLDPTTIMWQDGKYSGLPEQLHHYRSKENPYRRDWCHPMPLKCTTDPSTVEI
jgi:hypothetical protein